MMYWIGLVIVALLLLLLVYPSRRRPTPQVRDMAALVRTIRTPSPWGAGLYTAHWRVFGRVVRRLNGLRRHKIELFSFEKWLRDNDYTVQRAVRVVQTTKWRTLPSAEGTPRVALVARYVVEHGLADDRVRLHEALAHVQQSAPLYWQELAALPAAIAYAALEQLTYVARYSLLYRRTMRRTRSACRQRDDRDCYLYHKYRQGYPHRYAEQVLTARQNFYRALLDHETKVKQYLSVLQFASRLPNDYLMEQSLSLPKIATPDRAKISRETRLAYLTRISYWADRLNASEDSVVHAANTVARQRDCDFATVLFDPIALPRYAAKGQVRLRTATVGAQRGYIALVALLGLGIAAVPLVFGRDMAHLAAVPLALLFALPLVQDILGRIPTKRVRPDLRMGYSHVPDHARTIVVVSRYIDDEETLHDAVIQLRQLAEGSPKENLTYCMLIDFAASNVAWSDRDEALLDAVKGYAAEDGLLYAVRGRIKEERYVAWERKRGAILDMFALVLYGRKEPFRYLSAMPDVCEYAVLLDDDSRLLPGGVLDAVNCILHPANRQYDIMTFAPANNLFSIRTLYAMRYRGDAGSGYPLACDAFDNRFGTALYSGKAIVRIRTFYEGMADRLPDRRILSHDLLEGAMLRTGATNRPVFEDVPNSLAAHADRLARWQRGDVLLLPYLAKVGKNRKGERVLNTMQPIYRYVLLVNALAPLGDAALLLCLFLGILTRSPSLWGLAAGVLATPFVLDWARNIPSLWRRRLRYTLGDALRILLLAAERVLLLPFYAYRGATLFVSTLLRSMFSRKNLLVWKPFFRVQKSKNVLRYVTMFLPSKIALAVLGILSFNRVFLFFAGVYWLLTLLYYFPWQHKAHSLDAAYREQMRLLADDTYRYFCTFDQGIVQDTVQVRPPANSPAMSSPTDMGFALLAHACAILLGADAKACFERIRRDLEHIRRLPKWRGHLYNWYSMEGKVLSDTVSTVDSANLAVCLLTVRQLALEHGQREIADTCRALADVDFGALYDGDRNLLAIAYHVGEGRYEGHYDTLASEARLAYLLACAKGTPLQAYYGLSRDITAYRGNTVISWGGTAFEYLMPRLFVRPPRDTLVGRAERNCAVLQSRKGDGGIYGISESCCLGFNDQMRYRYQANGLDVLSLHPDCGETAYSPYAAALTMAYLPDRGAAALVRMQQVGMQGEYGLYEAYQEGTCLATYMAHHQGMLLAALTNALCEDALCRLCMRDEWMANAALLLCEQPNKQRRTFRSVKRIPDAAYRPTVYTYAYPKRAAQVLVCGDTHGIYLSDGRQETVIHGNLVGGLAIGNDYDPDRKCVVRRVGQSTPCSPYPLDDEAEYAFAVSGGGVLYRNVTAGLSEEIRLLPDGQGELRDLCIYNPDNEAHEYEVVLYGAVSLCHRDAYLSHPAYCDLFVETEIEPTGVAAYRVNDQGQCVNRTVWTVHGLQQVAYTTDKRKVLERNDPAVRFDFDAEQGAGRVLYPCVAMRGTCRVAGKSSWHVYAYCRMTTEPIEEIYRRNAEQYEGRIMPYFGMAECLSDHAKLFDKYASTDIGPLLASCLLDGYDNAHGMQIRDRQPLVLAYTGRVRRDLDHAVAVRLLSAVVDARMAAGSEDANGALCARIAGAVTKDHVTFVPTGGEYARRDYLASRRPPDEHVMYETGEGYFTSPMTYAVRPFGRQTALPYSNVVSNGRAGFVLTENGGGFFFGANSRENKWTLWRNDVWQDEPTHLLLLYCEGRWVRLNDARYCRCEHSADASTYLTMVGASLVRAEYRIVGDHVTVTVTQSGEPRDVVLALRPLLDWHPNPYNYLKRLGAKRMVVQNAVTKQRLQLQCAHARFFCDEEGWRCAMQGNKGGNERVEWLGAVCRAPRCVFAFGESLEDDTPWVVLPAMRIDGDVSLNLLCMGLWRQTLNSRIMARSALYQCGGAWGYRDQLQDLCAYLYVDPDLVRDKLLDFAAHQYAEGDVMHWWHPPRTGVRTRITDDRLFLCYALSRYIEVTGDRGILQRSVPFLVSDKLREGENSRYETPAESKQTYPVLEHVKRAIAGVLRFGRHDLLLVGGGDWNDGINNIGLGGKGESVWLSMFAHWVLGMAEELCDTWKDWLLVARRRLRTGIAAAFGNDRFLAYYDDEGRPIGNGVGPCALYLMPQAFAAFCGAVNARVAAVALDTAKRLVDYDMGTVALFAPPFGREDKVGYVAAYPAGVRENGGQYTHAVAWYIKGLLTLGETEYAYEILQMINPVRRCATRKDSAVYKGEPYVLAADVYTDTLAGQAGWTWYTGSAGWLHRVILEDMYGIHILDGKLYVRPNLPKALQHSTLYFRWRGEQYAVHYSPSDSVELRLGPEGKAVPCVDLSVAAHPKEVCCLCKSRTK